MRDPGFRPQLKAGPMDIVLRGSPQHGHRFGRSRLERRDRSKPGSHVTPRWRELDSNPRSRGYGGDEVALRGSDCREADAIFTARDEPMLSRAASAASARTGLVRAMRPRITRHSSSATAVIESITAAEGASRSNRNRLGRASVRPIRPSAQAASLATTRSASSSSLVSRGMAAGDRRAHRQPPARISDASC